MEKMSETVAFFLPSLSGGGAERTILNLATGLAERGYRTDLVVVKAMGPYLRSLPETLRLVDLKARRALTCLPALARYLRREKPSWLFTALHVNCFAIVCAMLPGISTKILVSERNTLSVGSKNGTDLSAKLMPLLAKGLYPRADGIVAVSKGVAQDLVQSVGIPQNRVNFVYNPIITPLLQKKAEAPLNDPWFEDNRYATVLAVGRLTAQKDFTTLIKAFSKVVSRRACRLLILGEGEQRKHLESVVAEHDLHEYVRMPGFISNPYPYMRQAAVLVSSSKWEGLPGVLIEALYCGISIVATDCPSGTKEILAGGKYGRLVPVGDVQALADAMVSALDGEIPRPTSESWQRFALEPVVDQYIDLYLEK